MSTLERWLGGSPLGVLVKLVFLSLLVGILLAALGLTPLALVRNLVETIRSFFGYGLDAIRDFGAYILTGAVVVLPLWLVSRLMSAKR